MSKGCTVTEKSMEANMVEDSTVKKTGSDYNGRESQR